MANSKASRKANTNSTGAKSRSSAGVKAIARRQVSYGKKPARTAADVIAEARGQKSNLWFCIPAFIIPFLLTLISYIFFDVYPFGERSVLTLDLNGQYIYYFESLRDSFWGDGSAFYSWSRNLSGGFMGVIGYYLASPFTLIVMLLPRSMIIESVMIMQMCKVGAAGAAFCVYAQRSKKLAPLQSVVFSTMYAMMSYVVIQLIDPMWIDGPIFLPLIILGVEYLVDDGRKLNYIIPLAIMFVANFYIGFMVAIFVALYFGYYMFFGTDRKFKNVTEYVRTFGVMALATLVVLMLSAFMILPVYNALALGKFDFSEPDYSFKTMFKPLELVPCLLPNQYYSVNVDEGTLYYGRPEIYCGVLTFVLMPLYFMNKKIKTNKKIGNGLFLIIMFLCMYIKPLNMMWHGGQDPNWLPYRYSFLVSFLLVAMAAEVFANLDGYKLSLVETGATFGIITVLVLLFEAIRDNIKYAKEFITDPATGQEIRNEKYRGYDYIQEMPGKYTMKHDPHGTWEELFLGTILFGLILVVVYVAFVHGYSRLKSRKSKNILTLAVAAVVLFETGYNCYDSFRKIFLEVGNSDKSTYTEILEAPKLVDQLEEYDGSFYRAEKTYDRMVNDNLAYGLKGITHSSSVMNTRAIKLIEAMGYVTQSFESKYEGNSTLADSLLGIKYVLDNPNDSDNVNAEYIKRYSTTSMKNDNEEYTVDVYENPYALSIGFMADDDILRLGHLGNDNTFNSLNNFLSALLGKTQFIQNPDGSIGLAPEEYYEKVDLTNNFELGVDPFAGEVSNGQIRAKIYNHTDENGNSVPHYCFDAEPGAVDPVVNIHFTAQTDGDVYMRMDSVFRRKCNLWISNTADENGNFSNHKEYGQYFADNGTPLVRIGPFKKGEKVEVRLRILEQDGMTSFTGQNEYVMFKVDGGFTLYTFNSAKFQNDIVALQENPWVIDMDKSNDRYLEGKVTAKEGQILMTSIPYEPGWTIKVDGKKIDSLVKEKENAEGIVELYNENGSEGQVIVLDALIGIKLPAGEHTVSMKYTPPGFNLGVVTFVLGLAALVVFYIYDRKNNPILVAKRELKAKNKEMKKLGLSAEEAAAAETVAGTEKKKVQIIKSKGAVEPVISEAVKKKAEKAAEEEEKIRKKNDELIEKGRAYAENAEKELAEAEEESEDAGDEKAEPEKEESAKPETEKKSGNQNNSKPKNGNKKKKK
ncbi:MAG: YfhO family protein [Ruminococcus sp.]|nr:YfhO family protein [Ruminococcus sp.]